MPTLTVVAGPNGSGKSTLTRLGRQAFQHTPVLDPDAIGVSMQTIGVAGGSAIDAGRDVLRNAQELLAKNQSLVVETTLSGSTYLRMMARAKSQGYLLILLFVGTSDVSINMQRVRTRVLLGGHDVPEEDQIRRYPRSMENFRKAFALADEASVFDNSSTQGHRIVAIKHTEDIELFEPVPEWAGFLRDV